MKMNRGLPCLLAVLICGCAQVAPQGPHITMITCKPKFELKERPELHVMDSEGNLRTAFRQWLILDDGKQQFRILWGSPPTSRGPVALYNDLAYTFTIKVETRLETQIPKVIRVRKGNEIIYEAQE
jgi:hypothetical protein